MATDFRQILEKLKAEEQLLMARWAAVRDAIPSIELLASQGLRPDFEAVRSPVTSYIVDLSLPPHGNKYSALGTQDAILHLLLEQSGNALTTQQITDALLAGGIRTSSTDFLKFGECYFEPT